MKIATTTIGLVLLVLAAPLRAQEEVPDRLTLERAIEIARSANPAFRQSRNDERLADWNVREAYGQLLPQANANASVGWQGVIDD